MQRRRDLRALAVSFVAIAGVAMAAGACKRDRKNPATGEQAAVMFRGATTAGPEFDPAVMAGKRVLVNFWSPS